MNVTIIQHRQVFKNDDQKTRMSMIRFSNK